jgi:hypothetical protein
MAFLTCADAKSVATSPAQRRVEIARLLFVVDEIPKHERDKEELLDGMIDVVFSEIYSPVIGGAMEGRAAQARHICSREAGRHPWAAGLMETRMSPGQRAASTTTRRWDACGKQGFPSGMRCMLTTCSTPTPTASPSRRRRSVRDARAVGRDGEGHRGRQGGCEYPYLAEVVVEFATSVGYGNTEEFAFGLDFILDGLERLKRERSVLGR